MDASAATPAFALTTPLTLTRRRTRAARVRRRPRPQPKAYHDRADGEKMPPPAGRPPSPWVQAALLTLFEPAPQRVQPAAPRELVPKWFAVWHSLADLYALRFRLRPPTTTANPPPMTRKRPDDDIVLVEAPRLLEATGFDPARGLARVVVFVSDLMADAVVVEMVSRVDRPLDVALIVSGVVAAYASVDLISALYNWLRLNFSPNASLFGEQDVPHYSSTRSFSKLVAPHCALVIPCFAMMLASPPGELAGDAFMCYFLTFFSLLPAFGEWSAAERTPRMIAMLQSAGVIVRRSTEDAYHRLEYGVVCGMWDHFLKRMEVFAALERWIYVHSGGRIRPKVWDVAPHTVPEDLRDFVPGFTVEPPARET